MGLSGFLLFLTLGLMAAFHPTILSGFGLMQTDLGDTRFNNYILEHGYKWINGDPLHAIFWNPPFFFPATNVAAYSDILLGSAPLYWVTRLVGFLPDTSFQLWMIIVLAINYITAFLMLRKGLGLTLIGSIGGAYLFAFAAMRINQLGHQQLLPQFFSMLVIYSIIKLFENDSKSESNIWGPSVWIVLAVSSAVLQIFSGFYLGWFLFFGFLVMFVCSFMFRETRSEIAAMISKRWGSFLFFGLIGIIPALWMAVHYLDVPVSVRSWREVSSMVPRPLSWIHFGPSNPLYGSLNTFVDYSSLKMAHEHQIALGFLTALLIILGGRKAWTRKWGKPLIVASLTILMVALVYPFDLTPWRIVFDFIPGAGAIRAVSRICLVLLIPAVILLAFGLDCIRHKPLAVVALTVMCMEQVVTTASYDKFMARKDVEKIVGTLGTDQKPFYYAVAVKPDQTLSPPYKDQLDAMMAQLAINIPTINGYSGMHPEGWEMLREPSVQSRIEAIVLERRLQGWLQKSKQDLQSFRLVFSGDVASLPDHPEQLVFLKQDSFELIFGLESTRRLLVKGWSWDQKKEQDTFVWADASSSELCVPMKSGTQYKMTVSASHLDLPDKNQMLTVFLNGGRIQSFSMLPGRHDYTVHIPPQSSAQTNVIQFKYSYLAIPSKLGLFDDDRELAVAVYKISFTALSGDP